MKQDGDGRRRRAERDALSCWASDASEAKYSTKWLFGPKRKVGFGVGGSGRARTWPSRPNQVSRVFGRVPSALSSPSTAHSASSAARFYTPLPLRSSSLVLSLDLTRHACSSTSALGCLPLLTNVTVNSASPAPALLLALPRPLRPLRRAVRTLRRCPRRVPRITTRTRLRRLPLLLRARSALLSLPPLT